ncbi:MAG: hypothetical protein AAB922_03560 [Patescibacteria group bacterium]
MKIGLLWYDSLAVRPLEERIARGVAYYRDKYHIVANRCYVNPTTLGDKQIRVGIVEVLPSKTVLPNHFWIGVEE